MPAESTLAARSHATISASPLQGRLPKILPVSVEASKCFPVCQKVDLRSAEPRHEPCAGGPCGRRAASPARKGACRPGGHVIIRQLHLKMSRQSEDLSEPPDVRWSAQRTQSEIFGSP